LAGTPRVRPAGFYLDGEMAATEMRERLGLFGPVPDRPKFMLADLDKAMGASPKREQSRRRRVL
jgi:hypothetical protein